MSAATTAKRWTVAELAPLLNVDLTRPAPAAPVTVSGAEPVPELPPAVGAAMVAPLPLTEDGRPDRSAGHHRVVGACVDSGLTVGQTLTVVSRFAPSVAKYGARLGEQTAASYAKVSTDPRPLVLDLGDTGMDSWAPVDLGPYLRGEHTSVAPTCGLARDDRQHLLYPGKEHAVIGEMESGKSWVLIACAAAELIERHTVVYVHFEEVDPTDTVGRLQALGVPDHLISAQFRFVGPERPGDPTTRARLLDPPPSLAIFDGVNEAMSLHGWGVRDEDGAAAFRRHLVKPFTAVGAATLAADHVAKDPERRGRTALGSVHKVNGLSGSLILLENADPFGRGRRGRSHVYIAKDRPGHLRQHGQPTSTPGKTYMGELIVDDTRECVSFLDLRFLAPKPTTDADATIGPTLADDVCAVVAALPEGSVGSERQLLAEMRRAGHKVRDSHIRRAVDDLIVLGRLIATTGTRGAKGYRVTSTAAQDQE